MTSANTPRGVAPSTANLATIIRGLGGIMVGAALGYFLFVWLYRQGMYAMILPGALVGFGCGLAMQRVFRPLGIVAAIVALPLSIYLEWRFFPFIADGSLTYFLTHLHQVLPVHLLMIALGVIMAYWFGVGRDKAWR